MREHPCRAGRPRRVPPKRGLGLIALLSASLVVAAAAAFALDGHWEAARRKEIRAALRAPDRRSLQAPDPEDWRSTLLPAGTKAPPLALTDARTGRHVSLEEHRGRPVVLLLSSFG